MDKTILQGDIGLDLNLSDFENESSILINSRGGSLFEGLAMYDYVKGNNIEVGVIGVCASAATLPLIASKKRYGTPNSRYLIHNPWNMAVGDASEMEKSAKELLNEQNRTLDLYVLHLNINREEIQSLMNEERIIDADEALKINLITEIKNINEGSKKPEGTDINNLFTQFKMEFTMKDDEKKQLSGISSKLDDVLTKISAFFSPKNIMIQDTNGAELDFSEAETEEQIAVDMKVVVDGDANATGDYIKGDKTYVVVDGVLTEIRESEEEEEVDVEALKAENTALKEQLEGVQNNLNKKEGEVSKIKSSFDDVNKSLTSVKNELTAFKNKFSIDTPDPNLPTTQRNTNNRKAFK